MSRLCHYRHYRPRSGLDINHRDPLSGHGGRFDLIQFIFIALHSKTLCVASLFSATWKQLRFYCYVLSVGSGAERPF